MKLLERRMPEKLDYRPREPGASLRHSGWGLAAFIYGLALLIWFTLPVWGIKLEWADVFHNLAIAGPLMAMVGVVFAMCGNFQKDRKTILAWWALILNIV